MPALANTRPSSPRRRNPRATILLLAAPLLLLAACGGERGGIEVAREQLFALGYGPGEDQLDLFQLENAAGPQKTRISMREGIFYVSNGNGAKVLRLSSFGDVLSMIYNPERNPEPILLSPATEGTSPGRTARTYPFRAAGEIAVSPSQRIYVEDRLPPERRVADPATGALLDYTVLRFDGEGRLLDYLGQEGVGGTPFPYIVGLYVAQGEDLVVISMTQAGWLVHWFDERGMVRHALRVGREVLPRPEEGEALISSLDRIIPDSSGRRILLKIDYYKDAVDAQTGARSGIDYAGSWVFRMDAATGTVEDRWPIPAIEKAIKDAPEGGPSRYVRIPEFLGVSGERLFFLTAEDEGRSALSVFDRGSRSIGRYSIDIAADELFYTSMYLSPEGILCALLGTKYEARFVWWRFDRLLGPAGGGKAGSP